MVSSVEQEVILKAAENYFKAFKEVKPELLKQHFLPEFKKSGFLFDYEKNQWMDLDTRDLSEVKAWASQYNLNNTMPPSNPQLVLLTALEKIAVVKLEAEWAPGRWGVDFITLVKPNDVWFVIGIFWQSMVRS
jgi:hypothetical protein